MAGGCAAARATGVRPMLWVSKAGRGRSDGFPLKASGNGSMHTARSLESGDRISIGIRRIWGRSTARNMPLTTAGRKLNTRDRISRSATGWLCGTITAWRNAREPQDRRRRERSNPDHAFQHDAGKAAKLKWLPIAQTTAPARAGSAARYTSQAADF